MGQKKSVETAPRDLRIGSAVDKWRVTPKPPPAALPFLNVVSGETMVVLITTTVYPVALHWMTAPLIPVRCGGPDCPLCRAGHPFEIWDLLEVYVPDGREVRVLPVAPSPIPSGLRAQLLPILQAMEEDTGPAAEEAPAAVERRRTDRAEQAERLAADEAAHASALGRLDELSALLDLLAGTALVLSGYHRHDRGEWRRRRYDRDDRKPEGQDAGPGGAGGGAEPGQLG